MGARAWGLPTLEKTYGGAGLSPAQAQILREELGRLNAPNPTAGMGVGMLAPVLLEFGDEAQKRRFLPPIARGEVRWCQGFSEPGAGSDLAGLQTKCEDKGDHYLVNGQKIWTSGAHRADWCFCLVRTDKSKKHEGISLLLIDMKTPGVLARPLRLINDTAVFCETFFTDVKVPKENLLGPLNGGWPIAKRLLQHERNGQATGFVPGGAAADGSSSLPALAKKYIGVDENQRLADHDFRQRLTMFEMMRRAHLLTLKRVAAEARHATGPTAATSIMKNVASFIRADTAELTVEIMGNRGLGWDGEGFSREEIAAARIMGRAKAGTIAGGSQEVQWNVISKRILDLPDSGSAQVN
jgi:alkylation response protein AidB-like acyl-CoA dehydrogenase